MDQQEAFEKAMKMMESYQSGSDEVYQDSNLIETTDHESSDEAIEYVENTDDITVDIKPSISESNEVSIENNQTISPIKKVLDFIKSPVREDNSDLIESMIELSSSLEAIGVEAHELSSILSETEKTRLKMLQEQTKLGLVEKQYPIGNQTLSEIEPVAFIYNIKNNTNELAQSFIEALDQSGESEDQEEPFKEAKRIYEKLIANKLDPKNYILNKDHKKQYYKIIMDDDRISRTELEYILNFMKSSAFANSKIIKEREKYYKNHDKGKQGEFPDIKPLLDDVKKLKSTLNVRLEEFPLFMTPQEKKHLESFLPALDEYYKDQIAAFSGGKCYLPLAKNLQEIQNEIKKNMGVESLIKSSQSLGFTMQRLYILHWIAESLMKKKYNTTLGKAIISHTNKYPEKKSMFDPLLQAVFFRNNIAHNGIVWEPNDFEKHIEGYEYGIKLISDDLEIDLEKFKLQKMHKTMSQSETEDEASNEIGLTREQIRKIDAKLLESFNTYNHRKLAGLVRSLESRKISIERLIDEDIEHIKSLYIEICKPNSKIAKVVSERLSNEYFTTKFSKKYFNTSFDKLIKKIVDTREYANEKSTLGWMFKLAMIEKEGMIDSDNLKSINDLKAELNG